MDLAFDLSKYQSLKTGTYFKKLGKVVNVVGLTIESQGPDARLADICSIQPADTSLKPILAEVVGFKDRMTLLMPYESTDGIGSGSIVTNLEHPLMVKCSDDLLGRTLDGMGHPADGSEVIGEEYPVEATPPDPMDRVIISDVLPLGVKAVDGLLTVGKGQRIGIFAGSGVGKSTLMGMFARNTKAEVNVIALIGERGREVREFVERDLGPEGMARSVVVVATSDKPALERNKAAKTATAIAEYFRDQGKDVLLMMDSLTRFSMAQREIGLASGEQGISAFDICGDAQASGEGRQWSKGLHHGTLYGAGRRRRLQRAHHRYGEVHTGRTHSAEQEDRPAEPLPGDRYPDEHIQMYEPDRHEGAQGRGRKAQERHGDLQRGRGSDQYRSLQGRLQSEDRLCHIKDRCGK